MNAYEQNTKHISKELLKLYLSNNGYSRKTIYFTVFQQVIIPHNGEFSVVNFGDEELILDNKIENIDIVNEINILKALDIKTKITKTGIFLQKELGIVGKAKYVVELYLKWDIGDIYKLKSNVHYYIEQINKRIYEFNKINKNSVIYKELMYSDSLCIRNLKPSVIKRLTKLSEIDISKTLLSINEMLYMGDIIVVINKKKIKSIKFHFTKNIQFEKNIFHVAGFLGFLLDYNQSQKHHDICLRYIKAINKIDEVINTLEQTVLEYI